MEKPDFSKEVFDKYNESHQFSEAVDNLKIIFGIENLSNIELFHLRKITQDVLKMAKENNAHVKSLGLIDPQREIPHRFLLDLYGIDPFYLDKYSNSEEDHEGFMEYIRRVRDRAHLI